MNNKPFGSRKSRNFLSMIHENFIKTSETRKVGLFVDIPKISKFQNGSRPAIHSGNHAFRTLSACWIEFHIISHRLAISLRMGGNYVYSFQNFSGLFLPCSELSSFQIKPSTQYTSLSSNFLWLCVDLISNSMCYIITLCSNLSFSDSLVNRWFVHVSMWVLSRYCGCLW